MKIAISAETTIDIQQDLLTKYEISTIPYTFVLGDKEYADGEITTADIFEYVDKTGKLPKTNAVNRYTYEEYFKKLKESYDAVIHVCLSSKITSACENARAVAENMNNVYVIDSMSLSTGIALLCIYARELTKSINDPKKISAMVQDRAKSLQVSFVVDRLDYLYKGGRCNSLQVFGANLFKLHPRIILKDGKMTNDRKYRGVMDSVVKGYVNDTIKDFPNGDKSIAFVTYTSATEKMVSESVEALKDAGWTTVYTSFANCTVASHCGPKTLGILYFNDGDKITTLQ